MSFHNSVCSYQERGHYGDNKYRGNCSGYIIRDFCETYLPKNGLLVDPSIGGGTSLDVANEMGLNFFGTDLSQGFNLLTDDLATHVGQKADAIFWHPPYWNMIGYSGNVWGDDTNKWDLSKMNMDDFVESMVLALMNIHDSTTNNGHYGILMGNLRRKGNYYNLSAMVERVAPGKLVDEIIKIQHNCTSDNRSYNGSFVKIAHEKLLVFKKIGAALYFIDKTFKRLEKTAKLTWRAAVRRVLQTKDTKNWTLSEIYEHIKPYAEQSNNQHWKAKVRQILQNENYFSRVETGVYRLVK